MATAADFLKELESESRATRRCLERIPTEKFDFKPHPTSMNLGYLALLVAEVPRWIAIMIDKGEIDFASYKHAAIKTTEDLVTHFEENMEAARTALRHASETDLDKTFYLKANGKELLSEKNREYIGPTLNHWVHHRGQLTVYMRICEIAVPSIYGPSGDDQNY